MHKQSIIWVKNEVKPYSDFVRNTEIHRILYETHVTLKKIFFYTLTH